MVINTFSGIKLAWLVLWTEFRKDGRGKRKTDKAGFKTQPLREQKEAVRRNAFERNTRYSFTHSVKVSEDQFRSEGVLTANIGSIF